jgi:hypothetical protein
VPTDPLNLRCITAQHRHREAPLVRFHPDVAGPQTFGYVLVVELLIDPQQFACSLGSCRSVGVALITDSI